MGIINMFKKFCRVRRQNIHWKQVGIHPIGILHEAHAISPIITSLARGGVSPFPGTGAIEVALLRELLRDAAALPAL